jgi:sterol desaturase/sphingolipid hydroxylase (fatty acid hydroxylase superfamily)
VPWAIVAPAVTAGGLLLILGLERLFPYERGQPFLRPGFWTDIVFYAVVQSWAVGLVISGLIRGMDGLTGLSRLGLLSTWPLPLQVAFFVVTHDLYIYWFHRWQHRSPRLWRLHEAHHSGRDVDWLTSVRSHALEILVNQTIEFAPMVLLGASPDVPLIKATVGALWGTWIHSNVDVRTGRLQWIVNGPEAHRWHHALDDDAHGRNFATKLAVWDHLFGTAFRPSGRRPTGYGLGDAPFPSGYLAQQAYAFRPREA